MEADLQLIFEKTGIPLSVLQEQYNQWLQKGKKGKNKIIDHKLIALLAGVSPSTVSNYLNKKQGSISSEKAEVLRTIIDCLEYIPTNAAKRLRSLNKMCIGFVAPISNGKSSEYYLEILKGIKEESLKYGYSIDIYDIEENNDQNFFSKLPFLGLIDSLIIVSSTITAQYLAPLIKRKIPIIHINPRVEVTTPPFIGSVYSEAGTFSDLLNHLFCDHKYKNPVLISVDLNNYSQRIEKYRIFKEAMEKNLLDFKEGKNVLFLDSYRLSAGSIGYQKINEQNPDADVIVCLSDNIAIPIIRELEKAKKNTAVTGYADFEIAKIFDLTTMNQQIRLLGVKAVQQLFIGMRYIQYNSTYPEYHSEKVPAIFIKRRSCGCK